jgi:hypothetical protein
MAYGVRWFGGAFLLAAAALVALLAAAPGGARAAGETEYVAHFNAECVLAPGILNSKGTLKVTTRATGPESVSPGEELTLGNATITVVTPKSWGQSLYSLGAREARGAVTSTLLDATGAEPAKLNIAKPAEFPYGLPFETKVENREVEFTVPSESRTFPVGPYTVSGAAGEDVAVTVDTAPGFKESEGEYETTGEGILSEVVGYNAEGERAIGPLEVACTAPSGVTLGSIPIVAGSSGSTTTSTTATSSTTTATTTSSTSTSTSTTTSSTSTSTSTTTTSTSTGGGGGLKLEFKNWALSGSMTVKKLGETIYLPKGSTFNGKATIPGTLEGTTYVPPFTATIDTGGILPTKLRLTFTQVAPLVASIGPDPGHLGELLIKGSTSDNIGIQEVGLTGVGLPTECHTVSPVVFPLEIAESAETLLTGATSAGTTTLPADRCSGTSTLAGPALTALMSGPGNPFTFTIAPPGATGSPSGPSPESSGTGVSAGIGVEVGVGVGG